MTKSVESTLSFITVVAFVATVLFYDFDSDPVQYDCTKLYIYNDVPSEVVSECMRLINKQKYQTIT